MDEVPKTVPVVDAPKSPVENLTVETFEPKKSCRKCHGTGRLGFIEGDFNKPYYCTCIMKVKKDLTDVQKAAVAKATPTVIVEDRSAPGPTGMQGVGPCPQGLPGEPGTMGIPNDPPASV